MKRMQIFCVLVALVCVCFGVFAAIAETPCAHTNRKVELVSAATCTAGSVEREVCTLCGAQLDTWTNSDSLGHSWKTETVSAATCTEGSVEREVCSRCGEVNDQWTNSDKLGHSWKTETVSAATCTEGSVEREVCSRCAEVNDQWTNNDKLGHNWKTEIVSAATCTKGSVEREVCSRCGEENGRWTNSDAKGHTPGAAATCTNPQICTVCKAELTPAKGHTPGAAATCTNPQICTVCKAELAPAKGHTPGAAATCTSPQICTVCKAVLAPAKGHTPGAAATCTSPQICTICKTELAPAKGHTPGAPATCENAQICEVCGAVLADALQHSYTSTVFAPTESKQGFTRHTCTRCGKAYDDCFRKALGKPEQVVDGLQLTGADGKAVAYDTAEVNEQISTGDVEKKLLKITAQTGDQGTAIGHYDLVLTESIIEGVMSDGFAGICLHAGDAEIVLSLENFIKNDILADILKDQDAGNENVQFIIRLGQEEAEGITNALTPAYRVDVLLNINGSELDIGDIIGGMVIRLLDGGADSAKTDAGLYYQPKLASESISAIPAQATRTDEGWEVPILGSGVYAIIGK